MAGKVMKRYYISVGIKTPIFWFGGWFSSLKHRFDVHLPLFYIRDCFWLRTFNNQGLKKYRWESATVTHFMNNRRHD
jgi:hypothetical protein